ncbi:MAG: hypothetical protein IPF66_23130 [Holophagales bacterium]|nr:hypothetical protein [Holophagales bacterium]
MVLIRDVEGVRARDGRRSAGVGGGGRRAAAGRRKREKKMVSEEQDTMANVLKRLEGKGVRLAPPGRAKRSSGGSRRWGRSWPLPSGLSGREFFDAVVRIDQVSSVSVQVRGRRRHSRRPWIGTSEPCDREGLVGEEKSLARSVGCVSTET